MLPIMVMLQRHFIILHNLRKGNNAEWKGSTRRLLLEHPSMWTAASGRWASFPFLFRNRISCSSHYLCTLYLVLGPASYDSFFFFSIVPPSPSPPKVALGLNSSNLKSVWSLLCPSGKQSQYRSSWIIWFGVLGSKYFNVSSSHEMSSWPVALQGLSMQNFRPEQIPDQGASCSVNRTLAGPLHMNVERGLRLYQQLKRGKYFLLDGWFIMSFSALLKMEMFSWFLWEVTRRACSSLGFCGHLLHTKPTDHFSMELLPKMCPDCLPPAGFIIFSILQC